jgi:hypothetical protein
MNETGEAAAEAGTRYEGAVEAAEIEPVDRLEGDARALYAALPADGGTISNPALRDQLRWHGDENSERYFLARDQLEDVGLIVRGRGRGGTIRRTRIPELEHPVADRDLEESPEDVADAVADALRREYDLYEPLRRVIAAEWARDRRQKPICVEVTAHQGRRATGIWARPDIVSVEVRAFAYVPGKYLEVTTFEVKPSDAITVQAVYEALAHRRAATRSYVLLDVPADRREASESAVAELCEVARAHGIGVVTAEDPANYETWEEREVAVRVEPDPEQLDAFIGRQLSDRARGEIGLALR